MVRVGGGWMALDEFLVKNDPCRGEDAAPHSTTKPTKSKRAATDAAWCNSSHVLCLSLLSSVFNDLSISCFSCQTSALLNSLSFLLVHHHGSKMLRSESNSSITQSPIGWQISHFLTMLHEHEPTSGMCVCTSERVLLVLVPVCTTVGV